MEREQAVDLIRVCLKQIQPGELDAADLSEDMHLIGGNSPLDSIGLVSLIVEIEEQINDRVGLSLTLTDDRAMSQAHSPFRTVGTRASFVVQRLREASG